MNTLVSLPPHRPNPTGGRSLDPKPAQSALLTGFCTALFASLALVGATVNAAEDKAATAATNEEPISLDTFSVNTDRDYGYQATSTTSGTRTNELLRNLPMSVSVITKEFIEDIAATDPAGVYNFGLNIESANTTGIGNEYNGGGNAVIVRGFQASWGSRDGFIWYAVSDNFNTESLEILRGPSGNIYGDGRVGGVLNIASKRAKNRDFTSLALRWNSESSLRGTIDFNKRLSDKSAIRINLLNSEEYFWKDTAYDKRKGAAFAFTHDFSKRTRFSGNIERNIVRRTQQRAMMVDNFSTGYVLGSGSTLTPTAIAGTGTLQAAGTTQRWTVIGGQMVNLENTATATYRHTTGIPSNASTNVDQSIIPRSQQWNGPSDQLNHDSWAVNAAISQLIGDRTSFEFAFNLQASNRLDIYSNIDGPRRDVNSMLPDSKGILVPNPNFDQLYVEHRYTSSYYYNSVPSYRATLLRDMDVFSSKHRLILTASLRDEAFRLIQRQEMLTPSAIIGLGLTGTEAQQKNNVIRRRFYLKDGNSQLQRVDRADIDFSSEVPGGQKTHQPFYSYSVLDIGRFWKNRIITTAGARRDNFNVLATPVLTDPNTGLAVFGRNPDASIQTNRTLNLWTTKYNYGVVFSPINPFRVFYNYAENFQQNGSGVYMNGDSRLPRSGVGVDFGTSVYLFDDKITATVTRFDNTAQNEVTTAIANQAQADEMNALLGAGKYSTGSNGDTRSRNTKGWEFELVANPTRSWTISFKWSSRRVTNTDFVPRLADALSQMKKATTNSSLYALTEAQYNNLVVENLNSRNAWNLTTRYNFLTGPLKGARIGFYGYPKAEQTYVISGRPTLTYKGYFMANAFAGYNYKAFSKYKCDLQLNVENVLNNQTRIGSSYTNNSYLAPTKFILTHKINF